ncbi:hypothetical protein ZIOFF_068309 [Zingiber officinale]|uniref:Amino acid transporter transmembrane domain-containing protein n=2 Tax=Zingiber officinale TaxID=94328 RepID=A0A8J5CH16_ZINOF|nr:hypothetical protein ZIOFF_068309 [Zingiber officinale]
MKQAIGEGAYTTKVANGCLAVMDRSLGPRQKGFVLSDMKIFIFKPLWGDNVCYLEMPRQQMARFDSLAVEPLPISFVSASSTVLCPRSLEFRGKDLVILAAKQPFSGRNYLAVSLSTSSAVTMLPGWGCLRGSGLLVKGRGPKLRCRIVFTPGFEQQSQEFSGTNDLPMDGLGCIQRQSALEILSVSSAVHKCAFTAFVRRRFGTMKKQALVEPLPIATVRCLVDSRRFSDAAGALSGALLPSELLCLSSAISYSEVSAEEATGSHLLVADNPIRPQVLIQQQQGKDLVILAAKQPFSGRNYLAVSLRFQLNPNSRMVKWLPITSSRNAKWWYSAFHNVTAMVGAGVLSLPYAMSELGWGPGIAVMVISWIVTLYTLWQMVEMHEMVPGKRFDRYHELGQYAFGEKLGLYIVVPQQLIVEVGVCIVYMVTGGKSLKKFHDVICPDCKQIKLTFFIMIFASVHFVLSQLPNFNSISGVSLAAAVMSLSYSTIAWVASVDKGKQEHVEYGYKSDTQERTVMRFLAALGDVAFAYAGHNVVLEIQATIPSTPEKPSKKPMWKGVIVAYIVVALCYFPVAFVGYWAFGNGVEDNILVSLSRPHWLIAMANMMVVVHVIGSYQIYAMPVFDMMETVLVKRLRFPPGLTLRLITRSAYVAFTMFVGITFPFFGGLLSFFGGFAFAPTTYFLPCIMWLAIYKPRRFSLSWITNWICIILGVLLMILAPIGALRDIIGNIIDKQYKFYQ